MNKTRLSLWYVASYLLGGGASFMLLPQLSATLFMSNTAYPDIMLQTIGMFMVALGIIVLQIIRHRAEALYSTTLIVRTFISASLIVFFATTGNPLFLVLLGIVLLGVMMTGYSYLTEIGKTKAVHLER